MILNTLQMKIVIIQLISILLISNTSYSQSSIEEFLYGPTDSTFIPYRRANATTFVHNNIGFLVCGTDKTLWPHVKRKDLWAFDMTTKVWTKKANFPGSFSERGAAFVIDDKAYFYPGGSKEFWQYDILNDSWMRKSDFFEDRYSPSSFTINNTGYLGFGHKVGLNPYKNDLYKYEPVTDTWTQMASLPGSGRSEATTCTYNDKGFILGGTNLYTLDDFWEYNATLNSWTQKASYNLHPIRRAIGFSLGNLLYFGLGRNDNYTRSEYKNQPYLSIYNPATNSWNLGGSLGDAREQAFCFTYGNTAFWGGGFAEREPDYLQKKFDFKSYSNGAQTVIINQEDYILSHRPFGFSLYNNLYVGNYTSFMMYDNQLNIWIKKTLPSGINLEGANSFVYNNYGFLYDTYNRRLFRFDPSLNTWTLYSSNNILPRSTNYSTAFVNDNKVYITAGDNTDLIEINLDTKVWIKKNKIPISPREGLVSFSIGNKGYLGLGADPNNGNRFIDFYEYDASNDTWIRKKNFEITTQTISAGTGIGINGKGHIFGGNNGLQWNTGVDLNYFYCVYDPEQDDWVNYQIPYSNITSNRPIAVELDGYIYGGAGENKTQFLSKISLCDIPTPIILSQKTCNSDSLILKAQGCSGLARWDVFVDNIQIYDLHVADSIKVRLNGTQNEVSLNCRSMVNICQSSRRKVGFEKQVINTVYRPYVYQNNINGYSGGRYYLYAGQCGEGKVKWFKNPNLENSIFDENVYITENLQENTIYSAKCSIDGCLSPPSEISINIIKCPNEINMTEGNQFGGDLSATQKIISTTSTLIQTPTNFSAGNSIELLPGFLAEEAVFFAEIKTCNHE
ncbi:MAG: hypothetical protein CFE21_18310 [Bacteroidetes bacterium B1(2017)]|nr:MAG: hypothetical protein CFE21_18310 [Bacteroidetes bacterium B1(2017)]